MKDEAIGRDQRGIFNHLNRPDSIDSGKKNLATGSHQFPYFSRERHNPCMHMHMHMHQIQIYRPCLGIYVELTLCRLMSWAIKDLLQQ
jgi:hypothetical protein